jgi:DNA-binding Lrp family transcriptional regulator
MLEKSGLIERSVVLLNIEKVGFDVCAMVMVSFSKTTARSLDTLLAL